MGSRGARGARLDDDGASVAVPAGLPVALPSAPAPAFAVCLGAVDLAAAAAAMADCASAAASRAMRRSSGKVHRVSRVSWW